MSTMYFTFGGTKSTDKRIDDLTLIVRPIQAGTRERTAAIDGRPGVHYYGADLREAKIRTRGYMRATTMGERIGLIRDLQAWLVGEELQQLIFSDELDKFYMAKLTGEVTPAISGLLVYPDLLFLVPDGCAYAVNTKTAEFPLAPEADAPVNTGTAPCPAIITATMTDAATSIKITLTETGEYIHLDRPLAVGDEIYIDTGQRFVAVNGGDARGDVTYLSTYFWLPPGEFTLTADPATTISAEYRERWA